MSIEGRQLAPGMSAECRTEFGPANEALDYMARALALLDANGAPADAGAHLDLAMHRLRDWISDNTLR